MERRATDLGLPVHRVVSQRCATGACEGRGDPDAGSKPGRESRFQSLPSSLKGRAPRLKKIK